MSALQQITLFKELWLAFIELRENYDKNLLSLHGKEIDATGQEAYMCFIRFDQYDSSKVVTEAATSLFNKIIRLAEKEFGGGVAELKINHSDYRDKYLAGGDRDVRAGLAKTFDPVALWNELDAEFGGEKGENIAYEQAAAVLVDRFRLEADKPVSMIKGAVVLQHWVYIDSIDKKYGNNNRLHYNSAEYVSKVATALLTFASWAEDEGMVSDLETFKSQMNFNRRELISREKLLLGEKALVTTYLNKFEYRFLGGLGESLMMFVSLFGKLQPSKAAA